VADLVFEASIVASSCTMRIAALLSRSITASIAASNCASASWPMRCNSPVRRLSSSS